MRFFDLDSPFMSGLNKLADLVILNLLTLLGCLPVLTAGASLTAMHYVLLKMVRNEEGYVFRDWFKSFKRNFRQATVIWIIFLAAGTMAALDLWIIQENGGAIPLFMKVFLILVILIVYAAYVWVFPILARYDNTVIKTVANALTMAFRVLPRTILMGILAALPALIFIYLPQVFPIVFLFGFTVPGMACAVLYSPVFRRMEPEEDGKEEDGEL